jgi:hypothetical protein
MKLHIAGSTLPHTEAAPMADCFSNRPPTEQAITSTGTSAMCSPR